jgi:hypothetical protein
VSFDSASSELVDFATQQCNNAGADAANAFFRAATLFEQIQMAEEARTTFEDCARAHFKISALLGENILVTKVIPHHVASGNFARAAKFHNEIAENLENAHEFAKAITHFLEAAKFFAIETAPTLELIALRRVAALYVQLDPPQFGDAAKTFSICARNAAARPLTAMSASQDAAYATLCALAHDPESAFNLDLNAEFNKPPAGICVYVARIARAVQERNADAFEAAVFAFSAVFGGTSPDWTKNALQRIRSRIAD